MLQTGFEVLYAYNGDSFRTVQCHGPADGHFYKVIEVSQVLLEGTGGWSVVQHHFACPRVVKRGHATTDLNAAIRAGKVRVVRLVEAVSACQ
jgi:hypothetical protein